MSPVEIIFWLSVLLCLYPYAGYPLLLLGRAQFHPRPVTKADIAPTVSIIIAAHNEERQLAAKIENVIALDYPPGRREIIVASDGSTDSTPQIAASFEAEGVQLLQLPRCGKLNALNEAVAVASGEVLVFTDANAVFDPTALKKLVASFADPDVGGVCGNQKFDSHSPGGDSAGVGEDAYWTFDKALKQLESKTGSIVAADGSIYAVRNELYVQLKDGAQADDLAISARVVTCGGRRLVFEPDAVSYEAPPCDSGHEFRRKVRIANHGMRAIRNLEGGLNPFRTGFYAMRLWSHKVLRFTVPLFAAAALVACAALAPSSPFYSLLLAGQILFYALALAGWALRRSFGGRLKFLYLPFYFCLANAALLLGFIAMVRGNRIAIWEPQRDS